MSALPRGATVRSDAGLYGYERALRRAGLVHIAGADEAGRGACAGPLVAGAAILADTARPGSSRAWPTPSCSRRRPANAATPRSCAARSPGRWWSSTPRSATGSACTSPTSRRCAGPSPCSTCRPTTCSPTASRSTVSVSRGSRCGRATGSRPASRPRSVLAKVTRDRLMCEMHEDWPAYDFRTHKGYITDAHAAALAGARSVAGAPDAVRQRPARRGPGAAAGPLRGGSCREH